jgi:surface carbohydrate biosynthesis protein
MRCKKNIYFPIETTVRELDGKLLLSMFLMEKFNVYIGSRAKLMALALSDCNGVYCLKSLSHKESDFYKELNDRGFNIVLIHAEGGVYTKFVENSIKFAFPSDLAKYVSAVFVLGDKIRDYILEFCPSYSGKLVISGEMRFDLAKAFFRPLYNQSNSVNDSVLINTSFGLSNHMISDSWVENLIVNNIDLSSTHKKNLLEKKDLFKQHVQSYIQLVQKLALRFPSINFILRPHPEENLQNYRVALENYSNVVVNNIDNVNVALSRVNCVIHHDCTTGIEAYIANKLVLSYSTFESSIHDAWLPKFVSHRCSTFEQVEHFIEGIEKGLLEVDVETGNKSGVLKNFIFNSDHSTSSYNIISDYINKHYGSLKKFKISNFIGNIKLYLRFTLSDILRFDNKVPLDTKTQLLNIEEIKLKFNKLNSILKGKSFSINPTVKFHSKNVVILKNKNL